MYKQNYLRHVVFPGIFKFKFKGKKIQDLIFFLVLTGVPTSFYGFVSKDFLLDYRLLFVLFGLVYLIANLGKLRGFLKVPLSKYFILICVFTLFRFFHSIIDLNISFLEVTKIYRTNFHYPITTLGLLLYVCNMSKERIYRFFYWLITLQIVLSGAYFFNVISGLNIYTVVTKGDSENYNLLGQNLAAIPKYLNLVLVLGVYSLFSSRIENKRVYSMVLFPLILVVIIIVRNQLIVFLISISLIYILSLKRLNFSQNFKTVLVLITVIPIFGLIFSKNVTALLDKFESSGEIASQEFLSEGTYFFRLNLIEEAYESIVENDVLLIGNGYQRESSVGTYDYVLGGDTLLASILYTEGIIGLLLRLSLLILLLIYGLKNFRNKEKVLGSVLIISIIIPELLNIVQTKLLAHYSTTIFIIFVLFIYERKVKLNSKN